MALEDVMKAIVERARKEAREAEAKAKKKARKAVDEARAGAEKAEAERLAGARKDIDARFERERSSLQFTASRDVLMVRKDVLDELRERFFESVAGMGKAEHKKLLKTLLTEARTEMDKGTVSVCSRDKAVAKEVIKGMRGYSLGPDIDCLGGALISAPEGDRNLDLRYETILEDVWRSEMHNISLKLFGASAETPSRPAPPVDAAGAPPGSAGPADAAGPAVEDPGPSAPEPPAPERRAPPKTLELIEDDDEDDEQEEEEEDDEEEEDEDDDEDDEDDDEEEEEVEGNWDPDEEDWN